MYLPRNEKKGLFTLCREFLCSNCDRAVILQLGYFRLLGFYVHCCKTSDYYGYSYVSLYQSPENVGYSEKDKKKKGNSNDLDNCQKPQSVK